MLGVVRGRHVPILLATGHRAKRVGLGLPGGGREATPSRIQRARFRAHSWCQLMDSRPCCEATGVALLGASERLEPVGDLVEALFAGGLGEARVHLGVLVGLAGDRRLEVLLGVADGLARWRGRRLRRGTRGGRGRGRFRLRRPSGTARRRRGSPRRRPSGRTTGSGGWPGSRRRTPPSGSRGSWCR